MRTRLNVSFLVLLSLMLPLQSAFADEGKGVQKEIGVTVLMPALLNINLGVWGADDLPYVLRTSGMYYGDDVKGLQVELGYALKRTETFKHYVALEFITMHLKTRNGGALDYTGLGPSYGLNWHGFSFQVGFAFGSGTKDGGRITVPQLTTQVGYTVIL